MDSLSGSHLQAQSNSSLIPETMPVLSEVLSLAGVFGFDPSSVFLQDGPGGGRGQFLYSSIIIQTYACSMKSFKTTTSY